MSHPFGDLLSQHLHRRHGLSQAKLAAGILQDPSIIGKMCKGQRLRGSQARGRVCAIIDWLRQQAVLMTAEEANGLLIAASMAPLRPTDPSEAHLLQQLRLPAVALPPRRIPEPTSPSTNLPVSLTSFVGRGAATVEVTQLIANHRFVTLTGAGGVGKTRLALEVGKIMLNAPSLRVTHPKFPDGVWFVDLAPLTKPEAIPQRILDLWRVPEHSPLEALLAYLRAKELLLILDNCEHLIGACAELAETLLQHCPQLSLLATSREALNIGGETPWRVPSLTRPSVGASWDGAAAGLPPLPLEAYSRFEAVALFVERASVRRPGFALTVANASAIAQICSRLDGIPLALEMAAARMNIFTAEELARRLEGAFDGRFQLLTSGARTAPLRHQTLRATLAWSYSLLMAQEQDLLASLSVFSSGWRFPAAAEVTGCSLDHLAQLVNKSLVIADQQHGQTRYRLLETIRQFAAEQAFTDEQALQQVQRRHSGYYLHLLSEQAEPLQRPHQRSALDMLRADFANISAAWQWAVEQHEFALLDPAIHPLFLYCDVRGRVREGLMLFRAAANQLDKLLLATPVDSANLPSLWARLLLHVGACDVTLGNQQRGEQTLQAALPLLTQDSERSFALEYLAMAAVSQGELTLARTQLTESLAISRRGDDWAGMASAFHRFSLGNSDYPEVCRLCMESLALWQKVGRPDRIASVTLELGWHLWCMGDYAAASAHLRAGLALCEELDLPNEKAWALNSLGSVAWSVGDLATAERLQVEALSIYTALGRQGATGMCKADLSMTLAGVGRVAEAISLAQESVAIMRSVNNQMMLTMSLNCLSIAYLAAGDFVATRNTLVEVVRRAWEQGYLFSLMIALYYLAELWVLESQPPAQPGALDRQTLAVTTLSCVRTQPATWHFFKEKAAQLQAQIENTLPVDLRAAAIARGQTCTLDEMVATLLGTATAA